MEERLSVRREAVELVVRGVKDLEAITSCSTGTSSSLTASIAVTFHTSLLVATLKMLLNRRLIAIVNVKEV